MARDFNAGRALSADSLAVWRVAFEPYLMRAGRVVDVGSGTGRFAVLLAAWFDVVVIGVEPARGMRDVAAAPGRHPDVFYVGGRAEQLPSVKNRSPSLFFPTSTSTLLIALPLHRN